MVIAAILLVFHIIIVIKVDINLNQTYAINAILSYKSIRIKLADGSTAVINVILIRY